MNHSENDRKSEWRVSPIFVIAAMIFTFVFVGAISGGSHIGKAGRRKVAAVQIDGLCVALDLFKNENGYYPSGTNALNDLMVKPAGANNWHQYYDSRDGKIPLDPWGHAYLYEFPGKHRTNSYDLSSAGPDGKFGTEDDIANWRWQTNQ
jgi:general secretion pathway protein G